MIANKLSYFFLRLGIVMIPFMGLRIGKTTLSDILFFSSIVFFVFARNMSRLTFVPRKYILAFYLVVMFGLLNSLMSRSPGDSSFALMKFLIMLVGYTLLIRWHLTFSKKLNSLLNAYIIGSLIFSVQYILGYYFSYSENKSQRYMGLSDHVTNAAGCLLIGTSIVLTFLVERQKIKLYSFLLFIILWALILTGSISSFIAFFFTLLFSIMRRDRNRLGAFILIFSLIIFAVYLLQKFGFYDFVGRFRSTTSGRYNTSLSRILNISTSIKSITSDLHTFFLGVGLDKDSGLVQSDNQEILQVHNSLLQIFYQGGFFFMVSIIYLTSKGVNAALKLRPQLVHKLILPCVAAIIFSFTSPLMYSRYIWFPLILCLSISELPFDNEQKNAPPGGE